MSTILQKQIIIEKVKSRVRVYQIIWLILFILPLSLNAQKVINNVFFINIPQDLQLVARDTITNKGNVIFEGQVDSTLTPYDKIQINVFRNGVSFDNSSYSQKLEYSNNLAVFNINVKIDSEEANYSFEVIGMKAKNLTIITNVVDVVAGDVYIIYGQSNAAANMHDINDSANGNKNDFIRVFERGSVDVDSNRWYLGQGDSDGGINGNTGQWGLKLAKMLIDSNHIPVAIFNGALGRARISDLLPGGSVVEFYEKLYYRLNYTGLKEHVRALFFSQGENTTNYNIYKDEFIKLKDYWKIDYPNIKKIYIFQTKNGCRTAQDDVFLNSIKEAQRQLAVENDDIHIMSTAALKHFYEPEVDWYCHFGFTNGYEKFGTRIYELVQRDFYGETPIVEIEPPMITDAYLTDDHTLVIETDAQNLINNSTPVTDFALLNEDGSNSSASISDIVVSYNKIIFSLSEYPGDNVSISYYGPPEGVQGNFITNSNLLELVCFYKYNIDVSRFTIWDGYNWSAGIPNSKRYAIIDGDYNDTSDNLITKNLTIKSGHTINYDGNSTNSVLVFGDLDVKGSLLVGDTESLIIKNTNARVTIGGAFAKKEKSRALKNIYDVTYWSSPVENAIIGSTFTNVDKNRIFYMDPTKQNSSYENTRYRHWFNSSLDELMIPGKGYSVDGKSDIDYSLPTQIEFEFRGIPNYKDVSIIINTYSPISNYDPDIDKANLIGNPYPAPINANLLIEGNEGKFDGTLYLWSHGTKYVSGEYNDADYRSYNKFGSNDSDINSPYFIASGQGFMVLASSSEEFIFKNSIQVDNMNDQFFKPDVENKIWLKLRNEKQEIEELLIGFANGATDGIDFGFDALSIKVGKNNFYSVLSNKKYSIQGIGPFNSEKTVDLGLDVSQVGKYTIGISKIEGDIIDEEIILIDNFLGIANDLKVSDYHFNLDDTGEFLNRFTLHFKAVSLGVDNFEKDTEISISNTVDGFKVKSNKMVTRIQVFDMLGRLLIQNSPNKHIFYLNSENINKGTLLVFESVLENGIVISKKAIKY